MGTLLSKYGVVETEVRRKNGTAPTVVSHTDEKETLYFTIIEQMKKD